MKKDNLFTIDSLANIYENTYYCVEYFNITEKIQFGIKKYIGDTYNETIFMFTSKLILYFFNADKRILLLSKLMILLI